MHTKDSGYVNPTFKGSQIAYFYGSDKGTHHISWAYLTYLERIPGFCLPIASDGMGNQIIMSLNEGSNGFIYWWDHENEWDVEDYEEENEGDKMPEQVKWQNMYLVASSFVEFFINLFTDEQVTQEF